MAETSADKPIEMELVVRNCLGLHARVAARIAETVRAHQCRVVLKKDGIEADGDSVLSILTLDAPVGTTLQVSASGAGAEAALAALAKLFDDGFGERR